MTGAPTSTAPTNKVLTVATDGDPGSVAGAGGFDPDVFYAVAAPSIIDSVYEGLVKYAPQSTRLIPSLATSWSVSDGGLTYTFQLRHNVHFHDGSLFTSQAVKLDFERRIELKQGSSYLLGQVASMETPNPYEFIVHLKVPYSGFLDGLASLYGLKMISPKALAAHADGDHAMKWLSDHEDGTGPYYLASYVRNTQITLKRFGAYWGKPAIAAEVDIKVIPSIGSQILQLESGAVDMTLIGVTAVQLPALAQQSQLAIATPATVTRDLMWLNFGKPPFNNLHFRQAFANAIDVSGGVKSVLGNITQPARSAFPEALLNPKLAPVSYPSQGGKAPSATPITLAYPAEIPDMGRLAQYYSQRAIAAGFNVTLKPVPENSIFSWPANLRSAPDAFISQGNPDDSSAVDFGQVYYRSTGGVNVLGYSDKRVDTLIDEAAAAPTKSRADQLMAEVGRQVTKDVGYIQIADQPDIFVVRKGITGAEHIYSNPWTANLATVRPPGS